MSSASGCNAAAAAANAGALVHTPVVIVDTVEACSDAARRIRAEAIASGASSKHGFVVGADMEWVAVKRTGKAKDVPADEHPTDHRTHQVAMVQLATPSCVYLFRMCCFRRRVDDDEPSATAAAAPALEDPDLPCYCPPPLAELLTNAAAEADGGPRLVFCGVGIDGDRTRFARDFDGVALGNCLDIALAYRALATSAAARRIGPDAPELSRRVVDAGTDSTIKSLSDFAQRVLGVTMPKDLFVTCSNWTKQTLRQDQVDYAAADAAVSHGLARALTDTFGFTGEAETPRATELLEFAATCTPVKSAADLAKKKKSANVAVKAPQPANPRKPARDPDAAGYAGRKQPYYGNIKVLEPAEAAREAGEPKPRVLFTVSVAKAEWYLKEELATLVCEGERLSDTSYVGRVIQLKFRPNLDRGAQDAQLRPDASFFAADKENCCVVCAADEPPGGVVRFFVVPQAYRRFFPREFVNHNSFDIVLVCVRCMRKVNVVYEAERKRLEDEFRYPISWHSSKAMRDAAAVAAEDGMASPSPTTASSTDGAPASLPAGLVVAEHNRTLLNMSKAASALIMAHTANEPVGASSRAKGKKVDLPPERFAALVLQVDDHIARYVFPDAAADLEAGTAPLYKGKPNWMDKYWGLLKEKCDDPSLPIVLPTTGAPAPNGTTWRDVYNVMRADRWKVRVKDTEPPSDATIGADESEENAGPPKLRALGASHFEFVVNETIRCALLGTAVGSGGVDDTGSRDASDEERQWLRDRIAALSGEGRGAARSGKAGAGPSTPRPALEGICRFIHRWRTLFLGQLAPVKMPAGWSPEQGLIGIDS